MDPATWTIVGGIVGALGFIYLVLIGQRPIAEWWRERQVQVPNSPQRHRAHGTPPKQRAQHNLPSRGTFVGREKYLQETFTAVASCASVVSIEGMGGIGKTALAIQVGYAYLGIGPISKKGRLRRTPAFDAVIWTTAKEGRLQLESILDTITRVLDYPSILQLPMPEKGFRVNQLLIEHKCLVIIDNFELITDKGVVSFLQELPEPSKALLTTRYQIWQDAYPISLPGLEYGEAMQLISEEAGRLGLQSLKTNKKAHKEIFEHTGGVPLAIKWATGQIKQRGQSLDSVLDSLYRAQGDLFTSMFGQAWNLLVDDARHILLTFPLLSSSLSKEAIGAATSLQGSTLTDGLGQLVEMRLVEPSLGAEKEAQLRYSIHPLVRAYVGQRQAGSSKFVTAAKKRLVEYYRDFAKVYGGNELGSRSRFDRIAEELENIHSVLEWCFTDDLWEQAKEIADSIMTFLSVDGYWERRIELCNKFVGIARDKKDKSAEALFLGRLAFILIYRGEYATAWSAAEQALAVSQNPGICEAKSLAWETMSLVHLWSDQVDVTKAREVREQALAMHQAAGDEYWTTIDHMVLGTIAVEGAEYTVAEEHLKSALQHAQQIDYQQARGQILSVLGYLYVLTGRTEAARGFLSEGLTIASQWQDLRVQALTVWQQSQLELKAGNRSTALRLARQAYDIALRLGMKREIPLIGNYVRVLEEKDRHWLRKSRSVDALTIRADD